MFINFYDFSNASILIKFEISFGNVEFFYAFWEFIENLIERMTKNIWCDSLSKCAFKKYRVVIFHHISRSFFPGTNNATSIERVIDRVGVEIQIHNFFRLTNEKKRKHRGFLNVNSRYAIWCFCTHIFIKQSLSSTVAKSAETKKLKN